MIDQAIIDSLVSDPKAASFRKRTASLVEQRLRSTEPREAFSYTDVLLAGEPFQTQVFMTLDGHGLTPNRNPDPNYATPFQSPDPIVIVALRSDGRINHPSKRRAPVPGKLDTRVESFMADFGNFARVPDLFPERLARMIIWRSGWPFRGSVGSRSGELVCEWRWLSNTATTVGDEAGHGITQLYEDILGRPGFKEFLAQPPTPTEPHAPPAGSYFPARRPAAASAESEGSKNRRDAK